MAQGNPGSVFPVGPFAGGRVRVAVVSTPRTGNTWLLHLLMAAYQCPGLGVHNPFDLAWDALPEDCVLQIHWHRTPAFVSQLEQAGFRVVVMSRHPFDALISILHFCLRDANTPRWLEGEEGNERCIYGAMPRSTAFADYVSGKRAQALLGISCEWWDFPGALGVRYEELNADPEGQLLRLAQAIGRELKVSPREAVEATSMSKLRSRFQNNHYFWLGKSGLWRCLLPAANAEPLARALAPVFETLGYACDPDPALTASEADANWLRLVWADVAEDLHHLAKAQKALKESQAKLAALQDLPPRYDEICRSFAEMKAHYEVNQKTLTDVWARFEQSHKALGEVGVLYEHAQKSVAELRARLEASERDARARLEASEKEVREACLQRDAARAEASHLRALCEEGREARDRLQAELEATRSLGTARGKLRAFANRHPALKATVKQILRRKSA